MNGILNRVRSWLNGSSHLAPITADRIKGKKTAPKGQPVLSLVEESDSLGPARCRHCGAELELVCPNGHGGADHVLADLVSPKRASAPKEETGMLQFSIPGCDAPRVPWKGRGRKPTRCAAHLTKHPEKKSA